MALESVQRLVTKSHIVQEQLPHEWLGSELLSFNLPCHQRWQKPKKKKSSLHLPSHWRLIPKEQPRPAPFSHLPPPFSFLSPLRPQDSSALLWDLHKWPSQTAAPWIRDRESTDGLRERQTANDGLRWWRRMCSWSSLGTCGRLLFPVNNKKGNMKKVDLETYR